MAKHFISVLGTGNYFKCNYMMNGEQVCSRYVQIASLKYAFKTVEPEDRITICLTDKAKEVNWEDREQDGQNRLGLYSELKLRYNEKNINPVHIATGETQAQIDEMFETIYEQIGEGEEVYFDITHGLRNIPMLVLSIIEYARVVKHITVGGIYYGAAEVSPRKKPPEIMDVPVFNLTSYMDILSWSRAADDFIKYGNSQGIVEMYLAYSGKKQLDPNEKDPLAKYVAALSCLTGCIDMARGMIVSMKTKKSQEKSIHAAYMNLKKRQKQLEPQLLESSDIKPLVALLDEIGRATSSFDREDNLETGIETIRWCIKKDMTQQGYTALNETIKTYVLQRCNLEALETKETWREGFAQRIVTSFRRGRQEAKRRDGENPSDEITRECWSEVWLNNFKIKDTEWAKCPIEKEEMISRGLKLIETLPLQFASEADAAAQERNNLNHFGFSDSPKEISKIKANLIKHFTAFEKEYLSWCAAQNEQSGAENTADL